MFLDAYKSLHLPLVDAFGVSYPEVFTNPLAEYRALRDAAGVLDLTHWGVLHVTGGDRVRLIDSMVTASVATLAAGRARPAALTTVKGKLVAELLVLARADELVVFVTQGDPSVVANVIETHIIADDVTLEDRTSEVGVLSIEGPKAREIVWRLFPEGPLPTDDLDATEVEYQGIPVTIVRHSVTGERGFHLAAPHPGLGRIRSYLLQAAAGVDGLAVGRTAWNVRRVEAGLPWFGLDVEGDFPKECRLDHLVDYEKGCYLGQETLARMHFRGHPNWLLVGLTPEGDVPEGLRAPAVLAADAGELVNLADDAPAVSAEVDALWLRGAVAAGAELFAAGDAQRSKAVGRVTTPTFSPALGSALVLAHVRRESAEPGSGLVLPLAGATAQWTVTPLPLEHSNKETT